MEKSLEIDRKHHMPVPGPPYIENKRLLLFLNTVEIIACCEQST